MLDKIREKFRDMEKKSKESKANNSQASSGSAYKCSRCGKSPLSGPVLYCNGCGQYMCYECGVPSGDMVWDCPNCAIETRRVVL